MYALAELVDELTGKFAKLFRFPTTLDFNITRVSNFSKCGLKAQCDP